MSGTVRGRCHSGVIVGSAVGSFEVQTASAQVGENVVVAMRPGALRVARSGGGPRTLRGTVRSWQYRGVEVVYRTQFGDEICEVVGSAREAMHHHGDPIDVVVHENALLLFHVEEDRSWRLDEEIPEVRPEDDLRVSADIAS